jgi:hypothetical protein
MHRPAVSASWEFDDLATPMALSIGFIACASLGALALYAHRSAHPGCDGGPTLDRVAEILRNDFHLDSIFVNDVKTVSGGFFSDSHDCSAQVTEIRGNVNASGMRWREVRYRIGYRDQSQRPIITVEMGDYVPLAGPPPSLWTRLLAYLGISAI